MYKGKFKTWIAMILLSAFIFNFSTVGTVFSNMASKAKEILPKRSATYNVLMDTNEHSLVTRVEGYSKSGATLKNTYSIDDADLLISNASDKTLEGYIKYEEQFYSPIVMYVPYSAYKNCEDAPGFKVKKDSSSSSHKYLEKDLATLFEALEQEKTWSDIGLNKIFGKGDVTIAIPKSGAENYEIVCEYIKFVLNGYSFENFDDDELNQHANKIIEKCEKYEDAVEYIDNILNARNKGVHACVLAPEFIQVEKYSIGGSSNSTYSYIVCYTPKSICLYYDLFIKNTEDNMQIGTLLKSLSQKNFSKSVGLRNVDAEFKIYKVEYFNYANPFISTEKQSITPT